METGGAGSGQGREGRVGKDKGLKACKSWPDHAAAATLPAATSQIAAMGRLGGRISRNEARRMTAIATDLHPNRKMLLRHLAAENAHDMAGTLATVHPDCVFRDFATGQEIGRAHV